MTALLTGILIVLVSGYVAFLYHVRADDVREEAAQASIEAEKERKAAECVDLAGTYPFTSGDVSVDRTIATAINTRGAPVSLTEIMDGGDVDLSAPALSDTSTQIVGEYHLVVTADLMVDITYDVVRADGVLPYTIAKFTRSGGAEENGVYAVTMDYEDESGAVFDTHTVVSVFTPEELSTTLVIPTPENPDQFDSFTTTRTDRVCQ